VVDLAMEGSRSARSGGRFALKTAGLLHIVVRGGAAARR
jgi:hypothetical protein